METIPAAVEDLANNQQVTMETIPEAVEDLANKLAGDYGNYSRGRGGSG